MQNWEHVRGIHIYPRTCKKSENSSFVRIMHDFFMFKIR